MLGKDNKNMGRFAEVNLPSSVGESLSGDTGSSKRAKNFLSFFQSNRPKKKRKKEKKKKEEVKTLLLITDNNNWFPGGTLMAVAAERSSLCGTQQEKISLQSLTVPLGLRGHWLLISVADSNSRIIQKCKGQPTSAPVSQSFEGTHLRTFSLTLRGAASQALTASSRVIPKVHLPQM